MLDLRVVVSGGAGFIGRHLVRRLLGEGARVTVLDSLLPAVHGDPAEAPDLGGARLVRGDVRDPDAWVAASEGGVDVVVHLAAETGTGESMYRSRQYVDVNVGGAAVLCDLITCRSVRPSRVVVASSRAVYGEGPYRSSAGEVVYPPPRPRAALEEGRWEPTGPAGEALEPLPAGAWASPAPCSAYGLTKLSQESLFHIALPPLGVSSVALRLQNVFGPGQSLRNPYTGILSIFSVQLINGERLRVFEDGQESRDFVYVDDVVDALTTSMRFDAGDVTTTVDIGSGVRTTVLEVAEALCARLGAPADRVVVTGEFRVGDVRHALADLRAAAERLDWRPKTPFADGLKELTDWIRGSDVPTSDLGSALDEMAAVGLMGRNRGGD